MNTLLSLSDPLPLLCVAVGTVYKKGVVFLKFSTCQIQLYIIFSKSKLCCILLYCSPLHQKCSGCKKNSLVSFYVHVVMIYGWHFMPGLSGV